VAPVGIAYRVQHTEGRDEPLARLLARLPPAVEVVTDTEAADRNPWRNYRRCLTDLPNGATHVVVLQDDALPCRDFGMRVREAVRERPDEIISLFVGGMREHRMAFNRAINRGDHWCEMRAQRIHHVVGLVWPAPAARDFLSWYEENELRIPAPRPHRSDDMVFSHWIKTGKPRRSVWATIPCLVEHPDDVPQVARSRQRPSDPGRRAVLFQE
jgi:hypothetical protein